MVEAVFTQNRGIWEKVKRINISYRNEIDERVAKAFLSKLDSMIRGLEMEEGRDGMTLELKETLTLAASFSKRLSKHLFLSKELKATVKKMRQLTKAREVAESQSVPFKALVENPDALKIITANHFHHKITAQHRESGMKIRFTGGKLTISIKSKKGIKESSICDLPQIFSDKYNSKTGKLKGVEFLADGLERHDSIKWNKLRPLYKLEEENGNYVHIDTVSGEKEIIGPKDCNYVQLVNVLPWGMLRPALWGKGAAFGHTWIRLVYKGELYHVGLNLDGKIVNPDFMATVPRKGKKFGKSNWETIDEGRPDQFGNKRTEALFKKLQLVQEYIKHGSVSRKAPYSRDVEKAYNRIEFELGATCSSGATLVFKSLTGKDLYKRSQLNLARLTINKYVQKFFDALLWVIPKNIKWHTTRYIQAVTRGGFPIILGKNLEN